MQYPIIDNLIYAYLRNGWTGLDIPDTIEINYHQEGSGDPSPDNIRPIHPGAVLNINGVDTPIYGGVIDVQNGTLTETTKLIKYNDYEPLEWEVVLQRVRTGEIPYAIKQSDISHDITISNAFKLLNQAGTSDPDAKGFTQISQRIYIAYKPEIATSEQMVTLLQDVNAVFTVNLINPVIYNIESSEIAKYLNGNISHRLKLPLPHYFPHPVIDALISASTGQQTEEQNEILRHYLTPLGIGGI